MEKYLIYVLIYILGFFTGALYEGPRILGIIKKYKEVEDGNK